MLPPESLAADHFDMEFLCYPRGSSSWTSIPPQQPLSLVHLTSADADLYDVSLLLCRRYAPDVQFPGGS